MKRTAPPRLVYDLVQPPRAVGGCLLAVAGLAAAGWWLWARGGAGATAWPALSGLLLWLLVCDRAWRCWRDWPRGRLEWDGGQWWLHGASRPQALAGAPRVCWDGQGFFLLSAELPRTGRCWLWLQKSSAPAFWGDLRRAVYWRAGPVTQA